MLSFPAANLLLCIGCRSEREDSQSSPDLILLGGDPPHGGSSPAEIVDRVRDLGSPGVLGNTDEMLFKSEALIEFAAQTAAATHELLGEERRAWLRVLPRMQIHAPMALVHASPESPWHSPMPEASDADLESVYGPLGQSIAVYRHIHQSFIGAFPK